MRVLLIEDDKRLAKLIVKLLKDEHFAVDMAHEGDAGLDLALRGIHDVAIIDWMLPKQDGPSICRKIRAAKLKIGILMLTARGQVEDRVLGLEMGADDYLAKPFAFDELLARVRALGRRVDPQNVHSSELRVGNLVLDLATHSARRGDHPLDLTKKEWTLLEYLMRHPNQVLTQHNILDYVWSFDTAIQPGMVAVYVSYLRAKIDQPGLRDPIETVRGVGYRLVPNYA